MSARELWKARLGEWIFGSAVAWGCVLPWSGAGGLLGGQPGPNAVPIGCSGTAAFPCTGGSHCTGTICDCIWDPPGSGDCIALEGFGCPTGCDQPTFGFRCTSGPMASCYYPD